MKYILLLMIFIVSPVAAEIYKWVDESGRVHFGDSPKEQDNAEKVTVKVISYEFVKLENIDFSQLEEMQNRSQQVEMYSTSWCGYCKKARQYFKREGIAFVEYDIEEDQSANGRFKKLGGKGVPLILVGNKKMSGFSIERFASLYQ